MDSGQGDFGSGFGPMVGPGAVPAKCREIDGRSVHRGVTRRWWRVRSRTLAVRCGSLGGVESEHR